MKNVIILSLHCATTTTVVTARECGRHSTVYEVTPVLRKRVECQHADEFFQDKIEPPLVNCLCAAIRPVSYGSTQTLDGWTTVIHCRLSEYAIGSALSKTYHLDPDPHGWSRTCVDCCRCSSPCCSTSYKSLIRLLVVSLLNSRLLCFVRRRRRRRSTPASGKITDLCPLQVIGKGGSEPAADLCMRH